MSLLPRSPIKSRRTRIVTVVVSAIISSVIYWAVGWTWNLTGGFGAKDPLVGSENELFDDRILDLTEPEIPSAERGETTTSPVKIDGKTGEVRYGRYANGKPMFEESWLYDKQNHSVFQIEDRGQKWMVEEQSPAWYLQGKSTKWYSNGQMAENESYHRYRLHGTYRTWYRNGQERAKIEYQDGLREGPSVYWHSNGTVNCRATFSTDRLEGTWELWNADGKSAARREYRGGAVISEEPMRPRKTFEYSGKLGSADFALIFAQGSALNGYNMLRVSASGWCDFSFSVLHQEVTPDGDIQGGCTWRRAEFQLSDEEQRLLREALEKADVFSLSILYAKLGLMDGTQWCVRLRAGGTEKQVRCDNNFPDALLELSTTLRERIMVPHKMELLTATRFKGEAIEPSKEAWPEIPEK
jgi:hypothetical protein